MLDLKDLFLTPLYFLMLFGIVQYLKSKEKNPAIRKVLVPAFLVKCVGAISIGLIYQFYYGWGDTFYYFQDSVLAFNRASSDFSTVFRFIFGDNEYDDELLILQRAMAYFRDPPTYIVVRFAIFFNLISFKTYTVDALFFGFFSFLGSVRLYKVAITEYPMLARKVAVAIFYLPSVFFWGAGLLKDSLTFGGLCFMCYGFYFGILKGENRIRNIVIFIISGYLVYKIKVYIALCFLPACIIWIYLNISDSIKSPFLKILITPLIIGLFSSATFLGMQEISGESQYNLNKISKELLVTSSYLKQVSEEGKYYDIGTFDGTFTSMLRLLPSAVNVTLYRPYLWESNTVFMILSGLENLLLLLLTLRALWRTFPGKFISMYKKENFLVVCTIFAVSFGFFIGIASANFGTLVRYKIPMMPFFVIALIILDNYKIINKKTTKKEGNNIRRTQKKKIPTGFIH